MNELQQIECRTGPLPYDERMTMRFGSRAAFERARAKAAIRTLSRRCMCSSDADTFRLWLDEQRIWRARMRALA